MRAPAALAVAAALAAVLVLAPPAAADARDAARIRALADRVALAWLPHQDERGRFVDPISRRPVAGYGSVMLGHALLEAGLRRDDARVVAAGVRAVNLALARPPRARGVFELLAVASAYRLARLRLRDHSAVRRALPRWRRWLRTTGPPALDPGIAGCIESPSCFHNHEAVEAAADMAALRTGLRSPVPGAKLADRTALRADAASLVTREATAALGRGGRATGPGARRGLGVLTDAGTYPLAYHALSTAMIADAVLALGGDAPRGSAGVMERATDSLAAFMGPDGDVSFVGRRQQAAWAPAAAVLAGQAGARRFAGDRDTAARHRALAARALTRLETVHGVSRRGLAAVPRFRLSTAGGFRGVDFVNTVVWNGLAVFLLNRAAEHAAAARGGSRAARLTADGGAFADPRAARLATVRAGDLWFAVNGRPLQPDLRYDFGLVAVKRRGPDGVWRDLVRPRPMTVRRPPSSAGPVIVRDGTTYLPYAARVAPGRGGTVVARGGFRSTGGADLGRSVTFRYAPVRGGVRVTFPVRAGDLVRMRTFLPARSAERTRSRAVRDAVSQATLRPRPARVRFERGYASCCDSRLVAALMEARARRDGRVTYTVTARGATAAGGSVARAGVGARVAAAR